MVDNDQRATVLCCFVLFYTAEDSLLVCTVLHMTVAAVAGFILLDDEEDDEISCPEASELIAAVTAFRRIRKRIRGAEDGSEPPRKHKKCDWERAHLCATRLSWP